MKIRSISIEKLYGKYDFSWRLDDEVNIIAGDNGSYKTTLLQIITSLCEPEKVANKYKLQRVTMELTNGVTIKYRSFNDSLLQLKKDAETDGMLSELMAKVQNDINNRVIGNMSDLTINAYVININQNGKDISIDDFKKKKHTFNLIATFDVPSTTDKAEETPDRSVLDMQLEKLESEYAYYLSDLSKQISDTIHQSGKADIDDINRIYRHNNLFLDIVNEAFGNTHKMVSKVQSKLLFDIENGETVSTRNLSSGEKQFLIIMLTILLQRQEESIIIMDEPEISMHLDWQHRLIANIQSLNPNCQIILATHSPGVIMDGWEQKVTNMSSIISLSKKDDE